MKKESSTNWNSRISRPILTSPESSWEDLSDPQSLHEAKLLKLNCDKTHVGLNWHSVLTIDECLQMTADWHKKYYMENQNADVYARCVEQLRSYMDKAKTKHLPREK